MTGDSNRLLLNIVEDLSYTYSDGRENRWNADEVQASRHEATLLAALGREHVSAG